MELREKLYLSRLQLKERRNQLREERAMASDIDARFVSLLRTTYQNGSIPEKGSLEQLYEELQNARDKLGILEYEYDQAEEEHDILEAELDEVEESGTQSDDTKEQAGDVIGGHDGQRWLYSPLPISKATSAIPNISVLEEYQSRLGDGNILWERLEDKLHAYDRSIQVHHARTNHSEEPTEVDLQHIHNLEDACNTARLELEEIEKEVKALGARATEAGFVISLPFWANNQEPGSPSYPISTEEQTISHKTTRQSDGALPFWANNQEPGSPSYPISTKEQTISHTITRQSDGALPSLGRSVYSVSARINVWLLHRLESSRLEQVRHKAILETTWNVFLEKESWAVSLLTWWRTDEFDDESTVMADNDLSIQAHLEILATPTVKRAMDNYNRHFPASQIVYEADELERDRLD